MSIFKKDVCAFCGHKYSSFWHEKCPHCDNIDFANILYCRIDNTEMTYHKEERLYWTRYYYDGSFHSLAEPYEVTIEDGLNYTFTIVYDNDRPPETRVYHETSIFCKRLLKKVENNPIQDSFNNVIEALSNFGNFRELTPEEMKAYLGPCAKVAKEKAEIRHYSKQELIEYLSQYYSEEEITEALLEVNINFKNAAVIRAKEYIEAFGGSYKSCLNCLKNFYKFTLEEATFGADNCGVDWKQEALRDAKKFIESNGEYSYEKMIFQLTWFDYTQEEAEYAVKELNLPHEESTDEQAKYATNK